MMLNRRPAVVLAACLTLAGTTVVSAAPTASSSASASSASAASASSGRQTRFTQINLISDLRGRAKLRDPKLVNPWGLAIGPISAIWSANTGTGSSTFYFGGATGIVKAPLDVVVEGGSPTGQVYNGTARFRVNGLPAMFIFNSESGHITAWSPTTLTKAVKVASVRGAIYKGLALARTPTGPRLLGADFHHSRIDAFDGAFRRIALPRGAFKDPSLPSGYGPFNVAAIGGSVYVAYAKQDSARVDEIPGAGKGFVTIFTSTGKKVRRFASRGALNAPWAVVKAPRSFGTYAGNILVGNFGDGRINAYDAKGRSRGPLRNAKGNPIRIDGLWGLAEGTHLAGGTGNLWFAAGIDNERHGLMGLIRPNR